jgi:hypothetical protein
MNKFLIHYPKLWTPKEGEIVRIIKTVPLNLRTPYYKNDGLCRLVISPYYDNDSYCGDFHEFTEIEMGYIGVCRIGKPGINFILESYEQVST